MTPEKMYYIKAMIRGEREMTEEGLALKDTLDEMVFDVFCS